MEGITINNSTIRDLLSEAAATPLCWISLFSILIITAIIFGYFFRDSPKYIFYMISLPFMFLLLLLELIFNFILSLKDKDQLRKNFIPWISESSQEDERIPTKTILQKIPLYPVSKSREAAPKQSNSANEVE